MHTPHGQKNALRIATLVFSAMLLGSCATPAGRAVSPGSGGPAVAAAPDTARCPDDGGLPQELRQHLAESPAPELLGQALGAPGEGRLCSGRVYTVTGKGTVTVYRLWNSTNPQSRLGRWWGLARPEGSVSGYRRDSAVCYQWSPLDRLTACTLQPGARLVVGPGQSAECSQYLTYPASPALQVYIDDASAAVAGCRDYEAYFDWRPAGN